MTDTLPGPNRTVDGVALYEGPNVRRMPALIQQGKVPISMQRIYARQTDVFRGAVDDPELVQRYVKEYTDSGDGVRVHPDGGVKFDWDSVELRGLNPDSELTPNGLLVVRNELFSYCEGPLFDAKTVAKYTGKGHKDAAALIANPLYTEGHMRGNHGLAQDRAEALFEYARGKRITGGLNVISVPAAQDKVVEGLWCADSLDSSDIRAGAWGDGGHLDYSNGRLGGVAPEAPARAYAPLDERVKAMDRREGFVPSGADTYALLARRPE